MEETENVWRMSGECLKHANSLKECLRQTKEGRKKIASGLPSMIGVFAQ